MQWYLSCRKINCTSLTVQNISHDPRGLMQSHTLQVVHSPTALFSPLPVSCFNVPVECKLSLPSDNVNNQSVCKNEQTVLSGTASIFGLHSYIYLHQSFLQQQHSFPSLVSVAWSCFVFPFFLCLIWLVPHLIYSYFINVLRLLSHIISHICTLLCATY